MTHYEITYIINPTLDEASKGDLIKKFDDVLKNQGAEIIESKDWQKRKLAYEISGYTEGMYHIIDIKSDNSNAINEFDRLSKINDGILRHMIIKRED